MVGLNDGFGAPRDRSLIRRQALTLRQMLAIEGEAAPNVAELLEVVLPELIPGFEFRVVENGSIGGDGGLTSWEPGPAISLEERVYNNLVRWGTRERFTASHEVGHLVLHRSQTQARNTAQERKIDPKFSLEWQANVFASEFLMPHSIIEDCKTPRELATLCRVSVEAAERRMRDCAMWPRGDERQRVIEGFAELKAFLAQKNSK